MNRVGSLGLALGLGCALLLAARPALAHDNAETLGVGAESPLALDSGPLEAFSDAFYRIPGVSVRYQVTRGFGMQLIFNARLGTDTREGTSEEVHKRLLGVSLRGHLSPFTVGPVNLGIVIGIGYSTLHIEDQFPDPDVQETRTQVGLELGLRPEWFVTGWLSFHTQVGVALTFHATDAGGGGLGTTTLSIGRAVDLFGNAGFTFWFGGSGAGDADGGSDDGGGGDDVDDAGWNYGADY